jgi:hypothetical protein
VAALPQPGLFSFGILGLIQIPAFAVYDNFSDHIPTLFWKKPLKDTNPLAQVNDLV